MATARCVGWSTCGKASLTLALNGPLIFLRKMSLMYSRRARRSRPETDARGRMSPVRKDAGSKDPRIRTRAYSSDGCMSLLEFQESLES
jgi:hypothetical protein